MNIVLTGNIGCGKSTVLNKFKEQLPHYAVHSVDDMVHKLYENPSFLQAVARQLGTSVRSELSDLVFNDPVAKAQLESISIQYLNAPIDRLMAGDDIIIEYPLFFEMPRHYARTNTMVVVIECDLDTQRQRIKARNAFTDEKIDHILSCQYSQKLKVSLADRSIDTTLGAEEVDAQVASVVQEVLATDLQNRFLRNFESAPMLNAIVNAYHEEHRHYHTWHHLVEMFTWFDKVKHLTFCPRAVELAIWFHDYVYRVQLHEYTNNEHRSVQQMWSLMKAHSPERFNELKYNYGIVGMASEFILATKGHKATSAYITANPKILNDCNMFLDIDMAIIASDKSRLLEYDQSVFKEFQNVVPLDMYNKKRKEVLTQFKQGPVFKTEYFAQFEERAQENLNILINECDKERKYD